MTLALLCNKMIKTRVLAQIYTEHLWKNTCMRSYFCNSAFVSLIVSTITVAQPLTAKKSELKDPLFAPSQSEKIPKISYQ